MSEFRVFAEACGREDHGDSPHAKPQHRRSKRSFFIFIFSNSIIYNEMMNNRIGYK